MNEGCQMNPRTCDDINIIKQHTARHAGQWKVLLVVLVLFITTALGVSVKMHEAQAQISQSATKIDKALASYIAGSEQRSHNLERRIEQEAARVDDHEKRLRVLENKR